MFIILLSLLKSIKAHEIILEVDFVYSGLKNLENSNFLKSSFHYAVCFLYEIVLLYLIQQNSQIVSYTEHALALNQT